MSFMSPMSHVPPLSQCPQLLLPHCRFTFHINILAREALLSPGAFIDQVSRTPGSPPWWHPDTWVSPPVAPRQLGPPGV